MMDEPAQSSGGGGKKLGSRTFCMLCNDQQGKCRWVTARTNVGEEVEVGSLCWSCNGEWAPYKGQYPTVEKFAAYCATESGAKAIATAAGKRKGSKAALAPDGHANLPQEVTQSRGVKTQIVRELWCVNSAEFNATFGKEPFARMPRAPVLEIPSETTNQLEPVWVFAVDDKVYPLRKMQLIWDHGARHTITMLQADGGASEFKAQAASKFAAATASSREVWSENILFTNAQVMTIARFHKTLSPTPVEDAGIPVTEAAF